MQTHRAARKTRALLLCNHKASICLMSSAPVIPLLTLLRVNLERETQRSQICQNAEGIYSQKALTNAAIFIAAQWA